MHQLPRVKSGHILQSLSAVKEHGAGQLLKCLDKTAPELSAFVQSNLGLLEIEFREAGLTAAHTKHLLHDLEAFTSACVLSVSIAHGPASIDQVDPGQTHTGDSTDDLGPPDGVDDPHLPE
jgi:hypothetical protein